jgi:hypothetical protein
MKLFKKRHLPVTFVAVLVMSALTWGAAIPGARQVIRSKIIGHAATSAGSIFSARTDTGSSATVTTGITAMSNVGCVSATAGGTAGDIRAESVVITGLDHNGTSITETLTAFTVNTTGTINGEKVFKKVTSILFPAMDGTGATISIEERGAPRAADTNSVATARTDTGASATVTTGTSINGLPIPRNITATAGGTAADVRAEQVVITGVDEAGTIISESLTAFTENTTGTVTGTSIFNSITSILYPAMDGTGATIAIGHGDLVGIGKRLKRNTVISTHLGGTLEGTAPTVLTDGTNLTDNTADLNSALNSTQVVIDYIETPDGE